MTKIVSFRPGVAEAKTAFEAMASIYKELQRTYDYEFTVVVAEDDGFRDDELNVETIPDTAWQSVVPSLPVYLRRLTYRRHVDPLFEAADLVLTLDPTAYPQGGLGIRRADRTDTPVWFDTSATVNGDFEPLQLLRRPFERSLLHRTDRILATVPKTVERFRDRRLYDSAIADRFEVLGHPVDTERFSPSETDDDQDDERVVLAVSRLVPEKGLYYVMEAVAPLLQSDPDLVFRILGSGPMESHLRRQADRLGVADSVAFLGTVPHEEVPEVLREADVFVNHAVGNSHWEEFFGVANLEAMACAVPPVVSDSGGVSYAIRDEDVAEMVSERSIVEIRSAIRSLLDDADRRERMGKLAREYVVEKYSVERISKRYHEMVRRTLAESGADP